MNRFLFVIVIIVRSNTSFGQIIIQGIVLNKETREPISYANIGIPNSNIGTLSNLDGSFSIPVPDKSGKDTLIFSALGYAKRAIPIQFIAHHVSHSHRHAEAILTSSLDKIEYIWEWI